MRTANVPAGDDVDAFTVNIAVPCPGAGKEACERVAVIPVLLELAVSETAELNPFIATA